MIVAVDFDGTVVQNAFPRIGEPLPGAIDGIYRLKKMGHKVVFWTCRCGPELAAVVDWCRINGVVPDAINSNVVATPGFAMPKILADVYLDDRGWPSFLDHGGWAGFLDWISTVGSHHEVQVHPQKW